LPSLPAGRALVQREGGTFHSAPPWDRMEAEGDPSARAIATYDR
jgi:hypothetical protein